VDNFNSCFVLVAVDTMASFTGRFNCFSNTGPVPICESSGLICTAPRFSGPGHQCRGGRQKKPPLSECRERHSQDARFECREPCMWQGSVDGANSSRKASKAWGERQLLWHHFLSMVLCSLNDNSRLHALLHGWRKFTMNQWTGLWH
jgi:hypothetical protein